MATEEQLDVSTDDSSILGGTSQGQRLFITNRTVSKLSFYLKRTGSPGGTLTFLIRAVDDDGILATKAWGNANDVSTSPSWLEVTFDSAVFINEESYILCTSSSGSAGNLINTYSSYPDDVKAGEYYVIRNAQGAYTNRTGRDFGYIYTYGEEGSAAPVVTTQACTDVITTSATGQGNLQSLGTSAVTQHGHCWNTSTDPTTSHSKTQNGATANKGPFTSSITDLRSGIKYYVRAYAINTTGTSYGTNATISTGITLTGGYIWIEGKEFHYIDQHGSERKIEGVPDTSGLPWWWYY